MRKKRPSFDAHQRAMRVECVDVFCGAGGLTCGLQKAGIHVSAGIDVDPDCRYPYEVNNSSRFVQANVATLRGEEIRKLYTKGSLTMLAGCAPCQPFSNYSQGRKAEDNRDWGLLLEFGRLVADVEPSVVTIENVPQLLGQKVFQEFLTRLRAYEVWYGVVDCAEYGLPQSRRRLVLLASRVGKVRLLNPREVRARRSSVWSAIGRLPPVEQGAADPHDPMHAAAGMSALNIRRIRASKPGGTWRDWPASLRAKCHTRESGDGYGAVYGRMMWERPAPTMTTLCYGFGNGRFGHPEQDRGISLREAALLQTFPRGYRFVPPGERVRFSSIGRLIGNAVPPRLGTLIGRSILHQLRR